MAIEEIEQAFPRLQDAQETIRSEATYRYNCIAFALHRTDRWWWPDPLGRSYWPEGAPRATTVPAIVEMLAAFGFAPCDDDRVEEGFEKVAVYVGTSGKPTHVARQLPSGTWISKLGALEDVEHDTLAELISDSYGEVAQILRRRLR